MTTGITYLEVPFSEKDQVKALGAWWDPAAKKWFVPRGRAVDPFERWLPELSDPGEEESTAE